VNLKHICNSNAFDLSLYQYALFCFVGFENKPFSEYLKSKKLTPNLLHYVLYAIAMATDTTPCMEGVARTQRFLNSLGRYGNTPFLWPMYGSGEIPQCFCRCDY
jgi:RAB protein geranylgeranyltransferase component A